ncbi:MAG TPA: anti-sigma factor, partial [Actinomycetota bacterium]|nr:anti-sigma factor [Actinomycetota bacterium]
TSLLHDDGRELRGEAGAVATIVPVRDGGVFVATGFDHAPADHTYQLWLIEDGRPESAGLFESSSGVVVLELSRDVTAYDAAAVTIEPAGGSSRPTGRPVVATDAELLG